MNLFGFIRVHGMSPLAEQVAKLGVCPHCHRKALRERHVGGGVSWNQCGACLHIYGLTICGTL